MKRMFENINVVFLVFFVFCLELLAFSIQLVRSFGRKVRILKLKTQIRGHTL